MYKVHLLIILASEGLAVYRERKKKKGKTSKRKIELSSRTHFITFIEPASSRNVLKSSRTFFRTFKEETCHNQMDDGKNMAARIGGKMWRLFKNICFGISRWQT